MYCRYIRIEIDGNKTYLRYTRGTIQAIASIDPVEHYSKTHRNLASSVANGGIRNALAYLRRDIKMQRIDARTADKLADKQPQAVLRLLRQKRERVWKQALEEKRPVGLARHVGVEIEFISSSDQHSIARTLAKHGVAQYVELKDDGSVKGDSDGGDCNGDCRQECNCADCGETHYCDDESECRRHTRNYGSQSNDSGWQVREDCRDCRDNESFETLDDCDCGGTDESREAGETICAGEHVVCVGHCHGHYCLGSEDHPYYDCNCECTCEDSSCGHEIAVVAKSCQIASVITKVCAALAEHDASVNDTCGLHVHVDMRAHNDVSRAFANLVNSQKLLYSMVPRSRYTNQYCQPNGSRDMGSYSSRWHGINPKSYNAHETLEVRLHSGTVNATKIINWISLLQSIAYSDLDLAPVTSLASFVASVKLPSALIDYIKARIEHFKGRHGAYSLPLGDLNAAVTDAAISTDHLPLEITVPPSYSPEYADHAHTVEPIADAYAYEVA